MPGTTYSGLLTTQRAPNSNASQIKSNPRGLKFDYQSSNSHSTGQKSTSKGPKLFLRGPKLTPISSKNRLPGCLQLTFRSPKLNSERKIDLPRPKSDSRGSNIDSQMPKFESQRPKIDSQRPKSTLRALKFTLGCQISTPLEAQN